MSDKFDQINKALSGFKGQRLTADVRDKMRAAISDVFSDDRLKWGNRYDIKCQLDREWIEHNDASDKPNPDALVEVILRNGTFLSGKASSFDWGLPFVERSCDIVKCRFSIGGGGGGSITITTQAVNPLIQGTK